MIRKKITVTTKAIASATRSQNRFPQAPQKIGSTSTAKTSKTSVRKKKIIAELIPSLRAVKNAEPKILKETYKQKQRKAKQSFSAALVAD
ncbi:hypothetical protein CQA66_05005 [Helicobacter aurati]|uniref:Uncharacterized protein n=1 Tax=Helicobacter aurati TaxID=137778 RepID=A0A3D8J6I0_9HELI|nr:hypothetical protein [Helicobacter aurati]RDU72421.1 hypothetical protein CQA66_05005 [Helicobacter aurati]